MVVMGREEEREEGRSSMGVSKRREVSIQSSIYLTTATL